MLNNATINTAMTGTILYTDTQFKYDEATLLHTERRRDTGHESTAQGTRIGKVMASNRLYSDMRRFRHRGR